MFEKKWELVCYDAEGRFDKTGKRRVADLPRGKFYTERGARRECASMNGAAFLMGSFMRYEYRRIDESR